MVLTDKKYKTLDVLRFVFKASPVCALLYMILSVIHAIMPTAAMALATANFVDMARVNMRICGVPRLFGTIELKY